MNRTDKEAGRQELPRYPIDNYLGTYQPTYPPTYLYLVTGYKVLYLVFNN